MTRAVGLVAPKLLGFCIDYVETGTVSAGRLALFAGLFLMVSLVVAAFLYGMRMNLITASRDMEYDLRNDLFTHLERLSPSFFRRVRTGDIMARATNDLNYVRNFLGPGIMHLAGAIVIPFAAILMFSIDARLAVLSLIPVPVVSTLVYLLRKSIHTRAELRQAQFSEISAMAQENFSGIRVVKAYASDDREIAAFDGACREYIDRNMSLARIDGLLFPLLGLLVGMMLAIIVTVGGRAVIQGRITLGDLTAFFGYVGMLMWPTAAIGWVVNMYQTATAALKRINEIFMEEPEIADAPDVLPVTDIEGGLEFKNVEFQYDGQSEPVLKDVSFKIPTGSTVAIVGRTGAGKSTLVHLIPRLFDPLKGSVLIDGHDVRKLPLEVLRQNVGFVPQEPFLFSTTVSSNIAYGADEASSIEIAEAARVSHILEDLDSFPDGMDTGLGERGVNLSGGQKQRITIGRASIGRPKIIVLDDALSSVDTETEEKILADLLDATAGSTRIVISHRISTVKNADSIVVLDDGRVAEQGTHTDLLAQDGLYADMYRRQLLEEEIEEA
jgi:ATP-binding cassette subfamily B protein